MTAANDNGGAGRTPRRDQSLFELLALVNAQLGLDVISRPALADLLGISLDTISLWESQGLVSFTPGSRTGFIHRDDLRQFLAKRPNLKHAKPRRRMRGNS